MQVMTVDPRSYAVLFVDDEPENLLAFRYAFEDQFTILTAGSGPEALAILGRTDVALLLTDQRMPDMTGVQLCEAARRLRPDAVRMIVTAYADLHAAIDAINKGQVARYLLKPWRNDEMAEVLRTAIDFFHLQRTVQEMEARLLHAGSSQAVLAAKTSLLHEIKNPLHALVVTLDHAGQLVGTLQAETEKEAQTSPLAQAIAELREVQLDARLAVQQLRDVTERYSPVRTRTHGSARADCGRVADSTIRILRREVERVARLQVQLDDSIEVAMDTGALGQVLLNLLLNAAQAIESAGTRDATISVRVQRDGAEAVVTITDTGPGIASPILERIFEPSFSTRSNGTGLGLTIAREIAEQHGGRLTAQSVQGQGTVLELRLPAL